MQVNDVWTTKIVFYTCRIFKANGLGRPFGPKCDIGDRMGCGINFESMKKNGLEQSIQVFFTKNGDEASSVFFQFSVLKKYSTIGWYSK